MSITTSDYALSGVCKDDFDFVAHRLLALSSRLAIVELNVWGKEKQHHCAKLGDGTDLRDAMGVLEISPKHASRLSCLIKLRLDASTTNVSITLVRRQRWTLVDGQLFLASFAQPPESHVGLQELIVELARIAEALDVAIVNVVDEDVSRPIGGTELLEPAVAAIFDPKALPAMSHSGVAVGGRRVLWFIQPRAFTEGETRVTEDLSRFVDACSEAWSVVCPGAIEESCLTVHRTSEGQAHRAP